MKRSNFPWSTNVSFKSAQKASEALVHAWEYFFFRTKVYIKEKSSASSTTNRSLYKTKFPNLQDSAYYEEWFYEQQCGPGFTKK